MNYSFVFHDMPPSNTKLCLRVKSRGEHVTTTTTGGIGVLDTGEGGCVVTTIFFVSIDVIKRRRVQTLI